MFDTVLVANRGEIACRVLRSVRALGLNGVAVYSDADADAPHVTLADRAIRLGPAPAAESYLSIPRILDAARAAGATAIHPGYGFLAENAAFARACAEAGIVFIGPSPSAIEQMGDKAAAKRLMNAAGVPCIPGYEGEDQSLTTLIEAGAQIGFPLMVKAAAGGGGRGMRRVASHDDLPGAIELARAEAMSAFGAHELILERAITGARHVEIQVMADDSGQAVHLGERDCSIQRRHQKIVEEAPCPVVGPDLRRRMGAAALRAAAAIDYCGAGTVEFLLDADHKFWFLEMNTRLQVEHPVTELVTGLDLVELQLRIARGESLGLIQDEISFDGHAIEARLYTEDPAQGFLPTTGRIEYWRPAAGPGVRIDDGIAPDQTIGPHYDSLAAKLIAWGPDRETARRRLLGALRETVLFGPVSNKAFLVDCLERDGFVSGEATTAFIDESDEAATGAGAADPLAEAVAAATVWFRSDRAAARAAGPGISRELLDWSSGIRLGSRYLIRSGDEAFDIDLLPLGGDRYLATTASDEFTVELIAFETHDARVDIAGWRMDLVFRPDDDSGLWLSVNGCDRHYQRVAPGQTDDEDEGGSGRVEAAMHGVIQTLAVEAGMRVDKGQSLLVIEAMKMQLQIAAPVAGEVIAIHVREGQQIATGDLLVTIEE